MTLAQFLSDRKMSLAEFGALIDVPNKPTVSRYARGERFPPPAVLVKIREVTNGLVTADDFADQHASAA